jgi:hypothetical protein
MSHQRYTLIPSGTMYNPFSNKLAFTLMMVRGGYVRGDVSSGYKYDSEEQALAAAKEAIAVYDKTGELPTLH